MIKTLIGYAVVATALLLWCFYAYRNSRTENRRLAENQQALSLETEHYRTRLGEEAASVQALRLRCAEFETLRAADPHKERINIPAIPRYRWRYRMHLTLERLLAAEDFNTTLCDMIALNGRR